MKKPFLLFLTSIFFIFTLKSQDIRGGRIQTKSMGGNTYSLTLCLYIDSAKNVNRPNTTIFFGDGTSAGSTLTYSAVIANGVICKKYSVNHTYSGPGAYNINYLDSFRIAGIKNISNSQTQKFYIETILNTNPFSGANSAPANSVPPVNFNCYGSQLMYNPGFFDPDGDSLSYALINCYNTSSYYLPGTAMVDPYGSFSFSKDSIGLYAFRYKIQEWRLDIDTNYYMVGSSDMEFVTDLKPAVGIRELEKDNLIIISPNPSSGVINIQSEKEPKNIEIENTLGQKVLVVSSTKRIDVSELNNGIYYLKIIFSDNEVVGKKIVKQ